MHTPSDSIDSTTAGEAAEAVVVSAYRDVMISDCRDWRTPAPPASVSCLATDLTCEVAGMLGGLSGRVQLPRSSCLQTQIQPARSPLKLPAVQLTEDIEACVRLQRLPMNSGSSPDENHWGLDAEG